MDNLCGSCTNCCQGTLVRVYPDDIARWKQEQRYDILLCLDTWVDSTTYLKHKTTKKECLFLTPSGCSIYNTRPRVCRTFPSSKEQRERHNCHLP